MKIFIPGNVPSSKNSNVWTGSMLIKSKSTRKYVKESAHYYNIFESDFKKTFSTERKPFHVGLYFIRDSKRRFDYINACQIVADLMVKNGWLEDDNADEFVPEFLGYHVKKEDAGVVIMAIKDYTEVEL